MALSGAAASRAGSEFFVPVPRPDAVLRLFCFPYAGGAPWLFRDWCSEWLQVEVCTACLPGRGARSREPAAVHVGALIESFCDRLATSYSGKPYALFGHSFGALMALGLAQAVQHRGLPPPCHVFVSACAAPQPGRPMGPALARTDEELLAMLASNERLSDAVLRDVSLRQMALNSLRADFLLSAAFEAQARPMPVPLTAFFGRADPQTTPTSMQSWRVFTSDRFELHALPGGHFFLHEQRATLLAIIGRALIASPRVV